MPEAASDRRRLALDHLRAALQHARQMGNTLGAVACEFAIAVIDNETEFGALLRRRREAAGWTITELASRTRLAENTLRNYEAGRTIPAPSSLGQLLGVPQLQLIADHAGPVTPIELQPNCYLPQRYDPSGMAQDLRAAVNGPGGTLEQSHLYLDNQSATDYLAVCEAYSSTRGALFAELKTMAERIAAYGFKGDVVAIGSGDGRAEVCLTRELAQCAAVQRLFLLDISHTLLTRAQDHAALVLRPRVEVRAVHGNFHELQRYSMIHGGAGKPLRLYTLLGATIANLADELRFFRDLHSCSAQGDLALIDYQIAHVPATEDPALTAGSLPKILTDWHAGPLRRNNPNVRDVSIKIELAPGHLPGSHAVVFVATATMADQSSRIYRVGSSSRYATETLSAALAGTGWQTLHTARYEQRTAIMLLRRT